MGDGISSEVTMILEGVDMMMAVHVQKDKEACLRQKRLFVLPYAIKILYLLVFITYIYMSYHSNNG